MSNPFDQFAMPAAPPPAAPPQPFYGAPPSDPSMMGEPQPGFGGPPYGAPPSAYGQSLYGAPPPPQQQQPPAQPPAASDPFAAYGQPAPAPAAPAGYPGMEQQLQQQQALPAQQQQQPPPPSDNANPFGGAPEMPPAADPANPFGGVAAAAVAAPPTAAPPAAPPADPWGGGPPPPAAPEPQTSYGAPPPPAQPYGAPPPQPYGAPPAQRQQQQQQPPQPYGASSFGDPQQQQQQPPADVSALVVSQTQSNPYAQQPPPNPYGQPYGQPPPAYGQPLAYGQAYPPAPPPPAVDPFSVFESSSSSQQALVPAPTPAVEASSAAPTPAAPAATASDDDFWGSFGNSNVQTGTDASTATPSSTIQEEKKGEDGLPAGGEWYDAKIFTPTLGVMFFKPQELTDSLFLNTDRSIVDALGERPVVAFIVEGSSARSAGVELGHVLLKVNGVDVKNPKDASRLIKEGPRPLPLLFYVPNTDVVVAEGEHMVKYDTRDTTAPNSAKDWKPKYVVIGGIIAQPWMMNMYRSKSEYDIAVIETQARRPVSVKVKQFSLQGARIQNDWQGPQMVKYKNKLQPWKYIVVLPVGRNPIKISSPNLAQLKPVHEGIRRVLLAQQRERGSRGGGGSSSGGGYHQQDYPQPHQQPSYRY